MTHMTHTTHMTQTTHMTHKTHMTHMRVGSPVTSYEQHHIWERPSNSMMSWFKAGRPGEHFCAGMLSELTAAEDVYLQMYKLQKDVICMGFLSFLLKLFKCLSQGWPIHVWLCVMCSCGPMPTAKSIWCWWRIWPQVRENWHSEEPQGTGCYIPLVCSHWLAKRF